MQLWDRALGGVAALESLASSRRRSARARDRPTESTRGALNPLPRVEAGAASCGLTGAGLDEARLVGEHDGLDAVAQVELVEDARNVRLHRRRLDNELAGDLGVREAAGE